MDNGKSDGEIRTSDGRVRLGELDAVWWRVKPFSLMEYGAQPMPVIEGFIEREWRSTLGSLSAFTPQAFWINPRSVDLLARDKPVQLRAAQQAGFAIPPTCISNDPQAVDGFVRAGSERSIYKPVTWYADLPDRFIFTSQIDLDEVEGGAEEIRVAPGIFQRRIRKEYEVRATLVGESVFAVRIDSQVLEGAELDWRRRQHQLQYSLHSLPDEVCERLLRLQRRLGLIYGAYDLIVTPENEHVFLEVNPLGQWLWLERLTGLPISRALAEALVQGV